MWQNFIIPAILNSPQLMRGDIGGYAKNTALQGGINMGVGSAMPNFNVGGAAPVANNINPALIGNQSLSQGITSNVTSDALSRGGMNLNQNLTSNIGTQPLANTAFMNPALQSQQNLGQQITPAYRNINPALVSDQAALEAYKENVPYVDQLVEKYRPRFEDIKQGVSEDYTGGGYSKSLADTALDYGKKGLEFAKENPMLLGLGALAAYRGIQPPQNQQRTVAPLGPQLGGKSVAIAPPLQVKRQTRRV
jgi:hypothetical protein